MTLLHVLLSAAILAGDPSTVARRVVYHQSDILPLYTQVGFVTAVHLPISEKIVDAHNANDEFFNVTYTGNVLYVKPGDFPGYGGLKTNLEIVCASGNTISFVVYEVSKMAAAHADLKVFVTEADAKAQEAAEAKPKYYTAEEVNELQIQDKQHEQILEHELAQIRNQLTIAATKEAAAITHDYQLIEHKGKDLHAAIYTDGKFTFIEVDAQELPSVWEIRDGKLNKIDAVYRDGRYTVEHVMDECELKVGKSEARYRKVQRDA